MPPTPENREQLQEGRHRGHKQRDLDEQRAVGSLDAAGVGNQDRRRDNADNGGDDVLKPERDELVCGRDSLIAEDRRRVMWGVFVHGRCLTIFVLDKKIFFAP